METQAPPWAEPFSLAGGPADESVLDAIVGCHGTAVAAWLLATHEERVSTASSELYEYIRDWSNGPSTFDVCWHGAFGAADLAVRGGSVDPLSVAVGIGLRLAETGTPGSWEVALPPRPTLLVGTNLLRRVERLSVDRGEFGTRLSARLSNGRTVEFDSSEIDLLRVVSGRFGTPSSDGVEYLRTVNGGIPLYLLPDSEVFQVGGEDYAFREFTVHGSVSDDVVDSFDEGCRLLEDVAPVYGRWVERVLRGVLISWEDDPSRAVSGSAEIAPGTIHASYGTRPVDIVEILVHEAAHQYFYMLEWVGPVDDGSDTKGYWSPPVGRDRPLSKILVAYHAFANIRLLYENARTSDRATKELLAYVNANTAHIDAALAGLNEPLRATTALTPLGQALYVPLERRISALGGSS